jgi:hypothetical protein
VIDERALRPVYQPLVHLETGRVIGYEGLIRPRPDRRSPGRFRRGRGGRRIVDSTACLDAVIAGATAIPAPAGHPQRLARTRRRPSSAQRAFSTCWTSRLPARPGHPGGHRARGHPRRSAGAGGARTMPGRRDPDRRG